MYILQVFIICTKRISKTTFETSSCSLRTSPNKSSTSSCIIVIDISKWRDNKRSIRRRYKDRKLSEDVLESAFQKVIH
jgi:hypothetical protein